MEWANEQELVELIHKELFSAVVGDILDEIGYRTQFLPPNIRPLDNMMTLVGRAMPVLLVDVNDPHESFGVIFEALDALKPGDVYLAAGASPHYALWGELMTTAAVMRQAVGAVLDGSVRDVHGILSFKQFSMFCTGITGQDQKGRGRAVDYGVSVTLGGVAIQPGDMLIGDIDGVVAVPRAVEDEVFTKALEKARAERMIKQDLLNGMLAAEAFRKYGIL